MSNLNYRLLEKDMLIYRPVSALYDDLSAEVLTLKQTNEEFRKDLGFKVKEIMGLKKE